MEKITINLDKVGNTLDVWFGKPQEAICEEVGNEVILKKNKSGKVIGFEKLNFTGSIKQLTDLPVEVIVH
jgi:hypothetical protein